MAVWHPRTRYIFWTRSVGRRLVKFNYRCEPYVSHLTKQTYSSHLIIIIQSIANTYGDGRRRTTRTYFILLAKIWPTVARAQCKESTFKGEVNAKQLENQQLLAPIGVGLFRFKMCPNQERLLLTPEDRGSNTLLNKIYIKHLLPVN